MAGLPSRIALARWIVRLHHADMTSRRLETARDLELARRRQDLRMRWILLMTVMVMVITPGTALILSGPSVGLCASGATGTALLTWIVHRLFPK